MKSILVHGVPALSMLCFYRARRYSARANLDAQQGKPEVEDLRPPVVYLRSFEADDKGAARISAMRPQTEEESLASLFVEIGPFLAIGKPHEKLPTLGAARLYVEDEEWEKVVTDLMSRARLVVLRTGETEGLLWEVHRAVRELPPEKLLLLVPFGKKSYERFRRKAQPFFPRPLPGYPTSKRPLANLQGGIIFEPDWRARLLPFKVGLWRGSFGDPSRSWRMGLRPLYERLGITWSSPPINWLRVTGAVVLTWALLYEGFDRIRERYRTPTPGEVAYRRYVERVVTAPELEQYKVRSIDMEPFILVRILTKRGLQRLSDESIVRYVALHRRLLEFTGEKACARITWGIATPRAFGESLDRLSPTEMQMWLALSEEAAMREIRQIPPVSPLGARRIEEARSRLLQGLSREEARLFEAGVLVYEKAGIKATCHVARELFARSDQARGEQKPLLAHVVVGLFY